MELLSKESLSYQIQRRVAFSCAAATFAIFLLNAGTGILSLHLSFRDLAVEPTVTVLLALAAVSFVTGLNDWVGFRIIQVSVFLLYATTASVLLDPGSLHAALFGVYGIILSIQYRFFRKHFYLKIGVMVLIFGILNVVSAIRTDERNYSSALGIVVLISLFIYLFWIVFAREIREYTAENSRLKEERNKNTVFVRFGKNMSGVIHNLKSVLMLIDGYGELVLMAPEEEKQQLVDQQKKATARMTEMINNFLTAVRSYQKTERQILSLNELVLGSAEVLKGSLAIKHKLKMETEVTTPDIVLAVPMEVMQIIDNVVRNAAEAMEGLPRYRLKISTAAEDGFVKLSVEDEGSGIKFCASCAERQCMRCPRFEIGKSTKPGGTGIGMVYVRQILKEYGGRFEIDSRVGEGTTVHLLFPSA